MESVNAKRSNAVAYDTLNVVYPVNKLYATGESSTSLSHSWRPSAEVLKQAKSLNEDTILYSRDHNVVRELYLSGSSKDFGYKTPESKRFYKHTPCLQNHYIYPPKRELEQRVPAERVFGTTEMRSSYREPAKRPALITNQHPLDHARKQPWDPVPVWSTGPDNPKPLCTTHEGFEKYLDPYLTTNRLEHRPFTAGQLARESVTKDILTYYTFTETPFVRTPIPDAGDWWLPLKRPKSALTYDRAKFKQDFRELRTHNKLAWVPSTFRTKARDNYVPPSKSIQNFENDVKHHYDSPISDKFIGSPDTLRKFPFD